VASSSASAAESPLVPDSYKLVWFVPPSHLRSTRDAVFVAGAGWIGDYSRCSWATLGEGTFRGGEGTSPAVGEAGRNETVAEYRVETVVPAEKLDAVVAALRRAHPYEEPAYDVYERVEA
jgi:structural hemagglutinin/hemolysin toxin protein RtxA